MADFATSYEATLLNEGGYRVETVPGDRGGQTFAGISRKAWPNWHGWAAIDAGAQPAAQDVRDFYRANFWTPLRLDEVSEQAVAASVYDFAVNAGRRTSAMLAQVVVGVTPDGQIGPVTLAALNACDARAFVPSFTLAKVARYRDICMRDRSQAKFLLGWLNRALKGLA